MTSWKNEQQFIEDRCLLSEFYYTHKNEPEKQFVYKSKKPEEKTLQSLYFDSDSEEEMPDYEIDSKTNLQRFNDISMQIKNAVGHRYRNDVIEKYFSTERQESKLKNRKSSATSNTLTSAVTCSVDSNDVPVKETESPATANTETKTIPFGCRRRRKGRNKCLPKSGNSSCSTSRKCNGDAGFHKSSDSFEMRNGFNHHTPNDHGKYFSQPPVQSINLRSNKEFPQL